jgi:FkbM family methyltransferase
MVIPSGFRQGRLFVRLEEAEAGTVSLLAARGQADATHQIVDACGAPLLTHLSERDAVVSGELMRYGLWEFAESMALLSVAWPGMTFLDVGANVGYFSTLLARTLKAPGRVYSFEPEPDNHFLLAVNALLTAQLFPQAAPITPFCRALAERDGPARLHVFERNLGLHSLVHTGGSARSMPVELATLDGLCFPRDGRPAAIPGRVDLLKADTQGAELLVLRGGEQLLARDRPLLCLELEPRPGPAEEHCRELVRWLDQHGYAEFRVFHANVRDPHQALSELANVWAASEVLDLIDRRAVGPYGSLLALPAEPRPLEGPPAGAR